MKANELRIGNYINSNEVEVVKVWMLTGSIINGIDINQEHSPFNPIALTEEWLLKFEAVKTYSLKNGFQSTYILEDRQFELSNSGNIYHAQSKKLIPYVHKLQNFIYALKDVELTMNP